MLRPISEKCGCLRFSAQTAYRLIIQSSILFKTLKKNHLSPGRAIQVKTLTGDNSKFRLHWIFFAALHSAGSA
jgi:hypothetical protein